MKNDNATLQEKIRDVKEFFRDSGQHMAKWLSYKEIGIRVAGIREELGIGLADLARLLDRPKSASDLGKIERGTLWQDQAEPNARLLLKIGALRGYGIEHFQEGGSTVSDRSEKIIAAQWMEALAAQLRRDAGATAPRSNEKDVGTSAGSRSLQRTMEAEEVVKRTPRPRKAGGKKGEK